MIFVFHGSDTFRSRKRIAEFVENFRAKAGAGLNIYRFDAEDGEPREFETLLSGSSLFSAKKLIIASNILAVSAAYDALKKYASFLGGAKDAILFLWEPELSDEAKKRLKEVLSYLAKSEEFKPFTAQQAAKFVKQEAEQKRISLDPAEETYLASFGSDLWAASNELEKIALSRMSEGGRVFAKSKKPSTIFDLGDSFFSYPSLAIGRLLELLSSGQDEFRIFSYLASQCRTLLTVKCDLEKNGAVSPKHGIHPFVIKKATAIARFLSSAVLQETLFRFHEEDWKIKTGVSTPRESLISMLIGSKN